MEGKIYPKVLIMGQSFNKKSGGGITISNLFAGWPKENLAVVSIDNLQSGFDSSICEQYYQLGYNGALHPFPFNLFLKKNKMGSIYLGQKDTTTIESVKPVKERRYHKIYFLLSKFLKFIGIYNVLYTLKITPEFKTWVQSYSPDIIYSQLQTVHLRRFVSDVHDLLNKPLVLHIMDDWPTYIDETGLLYFYWKRVIDIEFRKLMDKSTVLMSICESMSEEYKRRYNKTFIPFHNPIIIDDWLPYAKSQWETGDVFRILYTGRVGQATGNAILFMAKVINEINRNEIKMILDIYTPVVEKKASYIKKLRGVRTHNAVPYEKMPSLLPTYDLLFLPLDFDNTGIKFAQFSMPTKTPEYMISGTPILVYADKKTALAKFAIEDRWAYTVTENNKTILKQALVELNANHLLRKSLAERAKVLAIQNDNALVVREKFRKALALN